MPGLGGKESSNITGKDRDSQGTLKTERTAVGPTGGRQPADLGAIRPWRDSVGRITLKKRRGLGLAECARTVL